MERRLDSIASRVSWKRKFNRTDLVARWTAVEADCGMTDRRVVIECREAAAYCVRRQLGLVYGHQFRTPSDQHIIQYINFTEAETQRVLIKFSAPSHLKLRLTLERRARSIEIRDYFESTALLQ